MELQRFLILSSSRSGSNYLISLLNSHDDVQCEGEVLHDHDLARIHWANKQTRQTTDEDYALRESDPIAFLETRVFAPRADGIEASGFKLFYWQAAREPWRCVWPYLRDMAGLRVIHLMRRNQLERVLSEALAERTKRWHINRDEDAHEGVSIELPYAECFAAFERIRRLAAERAEYFAAKPMLDVYYEDLVGSFAEESARILEFLGVEVRALRSPLRKQVRQPPSAIIRNWDELKAAFAGTDWAPFFDA